MGDKLQTDSNGHVMPTGHNLDLIVERLDEVLAMLNLKQLEKEDAESVDNE